MTRWKPSVSSCVSSVFVIPSAMGSPPSCCRWLPRRPGSIQVIDVLFHVNREIERVFERKRARALGVAHFQRLDDLHVIDDRTPRAVVLADGGLADGAHVDEQILGH